MKRGFVQLLLAISIATGCRSAERADTRADLVAPEVAWVRWKPGSEKQVAVCRISNPTDRAYDYYGYAPDRPVVVLGHLGQSGWYDVNPLLCGHGIPLQTLAPGEDVEVELALEHWPDRLRASMAFYEFEGRTWTESLVVTRPFPARR